MDMDMDIDMDMTNVTDQSYVLPLIRQPTHLLIIYCVAYGIIFIIGLAGNSFVVIAVSLNISMRNITNYLITNLAIADLLIIILNLPATLASNIFYEWWLGDMMCKISVWITGATVSASVYTLVAVSSDRYCAICHTIRYSVVSKKRTFWVIIPIWIISGALFSPWLAYFKQITYTDDNITSATICFADFPSRDDERLFFLFANVLVAYFIPLVAITIFYVFIFRTFVNRGTLAVDKHAQERESRTKMRITKMMLVVIILFAASWAPLYILYLELYFINSDPHGHLFAVLRPFFQWLSLSNSCINPILYAYFSRRFRRAFQEILVMPCRKRYQDFKSYTSSTSRRWISTVRESRTFDFSGLTIRGGSSKRPSAFSFFGGSGKRPSTALSLFSKRPSAAPSVATSVTAAVTDTPNLYNHLSEGTIIEEMTRIPSGRRRTFSGKTFGPSRRRSTGIRRRDHQLVSVTDSLISERKGTQETSIADDSPASVYQREPSSSTENDTQYMFSVCDDTIDTDLRTPVRVPSQRRLDEEQRAARKAQKNGNALAVQIYSRQI